MMKPNIKPIFRGSKLVPRTSPRPAIATQAIGTSVTMIHQCRAMCACTPDAWTTEAIGSTMTADSTPWAAPESTLAMATSQMGQGAWTRSSISRVKPNSWAMARAIDCTPWNMIEIPTTPGSWRGPRSPRSWGAPSGASWRRPPTGWGHRRSAGSAAARLQTRPSVPQLLAREVDEDRLEAGLGDRQVDEIEPAALRRQDDARHEPVTALHMQLQPPIHGAGAGDARHVVGEQLREPVGVARGLHRDDGVGADALLQCGRRVEGEDPAVVHDGYPLAELVGLLHVVGGEQDGLAFAVQLTEQVP